jgi:hypothetical protein
MMGTMAKTSLRVLAALSLSVVLGLARAQDADSYEDPPDRAARLSYLSGDVSMQPAGEQDWAPAILNRPLTTGDKLWTERAARAEIQVGPADVRLGDDTGFSFLNVDDDTIQMRMTAGVVYVNVRALEGNDHIEIDTPNLALTVLRPGSYRVEVNDAGDTTTVRISEGEAEVDGPGQNVIVHAQQVATFRGTDELVADWGTLGAPDEFDRWNLDRDRRDERLAASRTAEYVSPDVTGYEDLDEYGSWSSEPEYGYVWTPTRVVAGWSPYRFGRWVWIGPWGWTWIDDSPWGYAPFHYGRWAHVRNRWCWVPGPRHHRAVYAPALVGWVGSPGLSVSVSIGSGVGWFPLGPREVYVPGRHFSRRYVERVNLSNTVIVNRAYLNEVYTTGGRHVDYRNRHVPGGFTAVTRATFLGAGHTGDRHARVNERDFDRATVSNTPHLLPVRQSRLGGTPRANTRVPPRTVVDRQVIVKREPPAAVARFMRSRASGEDLARAPTERFSRTPDRAAFERNRTDRPVSALPRPATPAQSGAQGTPESRVFTTRPRDDRPPKERNARGDDRSFERDREARMQEQPADARQRWQRTDDSGRSRELQDREVRQQQQQARELYQRRQDLDRQQAARETAARQMETRQRSDQRQQDAARQSAARQMEQRQQQDRPRVNERPNVSERPRVNERPNVSERPHVSERPRTSERPRSEPRAAPRQPSNDKPRQSRNDPNNPRAQRK